jgi:serine/threonine-protein kinase
MTDDAWGDVEALFADAMELDPDARQALLDARCAGRPALRAEIESLLASHGRDGRFLDVATIAPVTEAAPTVPDRSGEVVGRFRLVDRVGEGGMGVVYRAERADGEFSEQVAVKLLTTPIDTADAMRRFRVERQILATLNHPDIVTLIDGGLTGSGQAFLVMKYVEGEPIVDHCVRRRLTLAARIRLFQRVCAAVQYAHQNGVVHRDLKPANILVTDDGLPKILDFGVAKLLDRPGAAPEDSAVSAFQPMTPNYASPEQLRGLPVTTASDVYSLGMILYELLAGVRPYTTSNKPLDEVMRLVLETDPGRPSLAPPPELPDARPPYDRRALHGDLDAIVLCALRKAPDERYRSAAALADDLGRYLAGHPVEAREPSLGYVMHKLAARHRAVFATTAVSAGVVLVLLGLSIWQARVARDERDRARVESAKAREIADFLGRVFQGANPVQAGGRTLTARDLLDRGTASIAGELKGQPDIQASLLLVMSEAYERIGDQPKALEAALRSAALREQLPAGETAAQLAESLHLVGRTLRRLGRPAEAVAPLERALALRESRLGPDDRSVVQTLRELSLVHRDLGRPAAGALAMLQRAIRIEERTASGSATLALLYNNLATGLHEGGDLEAARAAYERSIAIYSAVEDGGGFAVSMPLVNLGTLMREREDLAAAESFLTRALALDDMWLGPENAGQAYVLGCLGDLARVQGDYGRAHRLLADSLRIYAKTRPPDHIELAPPLTYLGETLLAEGKVDAALPTLQRALRITERTHGQDHAAVAVVLVALARAHIQASQVDTGVQLASRAHSIQRRELAADHPVIVATLTVLGGGFMQQNRTADARPVLTEAVRIGTLRLPATHSQRREAEALLARLR